MKTELQKSIQLMISEDYKDRFKAEYIQLKNRYDNLSKMIDNWDKNKLSFTPTCPREIYTMHIESMKKYLDILIIRTKLENIEL